MLTTEANYDQIVIELIWTRQKIKNNISLFYTAWYQQLLTNDKVERSVNIYVITQIPFTVTVTQSERKSQRGIKQLKWSVEKLTTYLY